jgi:hypothetical protein
MLISVCLTDSVLVFHKHGMQGRNFRTGEVTQEITDQSRIFKLLGSDRYVSTYSVDLYKAGLTEIFLFQSELCHFIMCPGGTAFTIILDIVGAF